MISYNEIPTEPETCSICLCVIENKCYSNRCFHTFCFKCLKEWSLTQSTCPLCKQSFETIVHKLGFMKTFYIFEIQELPQISEILDLLVSRNIQLLSLLPDQSIDEDKFQYHNLDIYISAQSLWHPFGGIQIFEECALRTVIYVENMWADQLPYVSGFFNYASYVQRNDSYEVHNRLYNFINRDLIVIKSLLRSYNADDDISDSSEYLTIIVISKIIHGRRNGIPLLQYLYSYLIHHLKNYTSHFCHELFNYEKNPYDMKDYNRNVRYSTIRTSSIDLRYIYRVQIEVPFKEPNSGIPYSNSNHISNVE